MPVVRPALLTSLAVATSLLGAPREARADSVEVCVAAVASGQKLQRTGELRAARATFLSCDKNECPAEVRAVCDRLVNTVEASLPTVIFGARDSAHRDLVAVRVRVDGAPVAETMDGKAVPMDPGHHVFRFERDGSAPIEQDFVIREAEKNRPILVTFPEAGSPVPPPDVVRDDRPRRPVPPLVYVLTGVGVASLGVFIALDVNGQSRYDACEGHGCPASLSAERAATFAMAGLGLVSLGAATWLFLARPTEPPRTTAALSFDVTGLRGGGLLRALATF